ncbi:MAG: hypothetical protein Q8Q04_00210, partial [archaeon]|nr:hypothetical protein [archaeon]
TPTGRIIGQCYLGKKDLGEKLGWDGDYSWFGEADKVNPKIISPYYAVDRYAAMPEINEFLSKGGNWIIDRWTESNKGHQAGKINNFEGRLKMVTFIEKLENEILEICKPDLVVFLYLPLEYSIELRKKRDGGKLNQDGHESNMEHMKNAEESYLELSKLYKWNQIDCAMNGKIRSPEDIHEEVYSAVKNLL